MLKFCSLSSGSSGNCYYISTETTGILIDAGISCSRITKALTYLGESVDGVRAVFVTHEHTDHVSGLRVLLKKHEIALYATRGTYAEFLKTAGDVRMQMPPVVISSRDEIRIGDLTVYSYGISHDAAEPVCYKVCSDAGEALGIITDLGWADPEVVSAFGDVDLLLLESNHDVELLKIGPYPPFLKQRILSKSGHLSNDSAGVIARNILAKGRLKYLILGHLSEVNNHPDLAVATVDRAIREQGYVSGEDYELDVSLKNQVGKMYILRRLLLMFFALFGLLVPSALFADEVLLREQVQYDIPVLGVVFMENGVVTTRVSRELAEGKLRDCDLPFQAGGISRVTTSLALLQLMKEKGISPEDRLIDHLPKELRESRTDLEDLHFLDLFTHTTGFLNRRYRTLSEIPYEESIRARAVQHLLTAERRFDREEFSLLTNADFAFMTILIEELSGQLFAEYMRVFFDRMGMYHTYIESERREQGERNLLQRYFVEGAEKRPAPAYHAEIPAADDLVTTIGDVEKLLHYLTGRELPSSFKVFSRLYTNINEYNARSSVFNYVEFDGLGIYVLDAALPGAYGRIFFVPGERVGGFIHYNSDHIGARDAITRTLLSDYIRRQRDDAPAYVTAENQGILSGHYSPVNISSDGPEGFVAFSHQLRITSMDNDLLIDDVLYSPVSETVYYSAQLEKYARFVTDEDGRLRYLVLDNELYERRFSANTQLFLIGLFALCSLLISVSVWVKWRSLIAGRVDDRPRVWLLFGNLLYLFNIVWMYFAVRQTGYWPLAYGGGTASSVFQFVGWSVLPGILLNLMTMLYTGGDYKWSGQLRLLTWFNLPLACFYLFWLIRFRLIAFFL